MTKLNFGYPQVGSTYPTNEGVSRIAKIRKDHLASAQNRKQENALMVEPVQSWVYIRQQAGLHCTCQQVVSLTGDGSASEEYDPFVVSLQEDADAAYRAVVDKQNLHKYFDDKDNAQLLDEIGDEVSLISGNDKGFCGICMNTGWTSGYRLHNGDRLLGHIHNCNYTDAELDENTRPHSLYGTTGAELSWEFMVPMGVEKVLHFSLHNNCNLVPAVVTINDIPLTEESIKQFSGQKVTVKAVPISKEWKCTHFDIWLTFSDTFIDYPAVQKDSDFQYFEALQTIHFETLGSIPYVDRESLICEVKHGELWKVTNATARMNSEKQLIKTEVDARLVQKNELLHYLNFVNYPMKVYSYQSLERFQSYYSQYMNRTRRLR